MDNFEEIISYNTKSYNYSLEYYVHNVKEYLTQNPNMIDEIKPIIFEYSIDIINYIKKSLYWNDLIMQETYEKNKSKIIRHDLDMENYINFDKIMQDINNNNNLGLMSFEKRAKTAIIVIAFNLIKIYGIQMVKEKSDIIKKEIKFGTFHARIMDKDNNFCELLNKLGYTYGEQSIEYFRNLLLLKERLNSLLNLNVDKNEENKIKQLLLKIQKIQTSMPSDIQINLQMDYMLDKIEWYCAPDCVSSDDIKLKSIDTLEESKKSIEEKREHFIKRGNNYLKSHPTKKENPFYSYIKELTKAIEIIEESQREIKQIEYNPNDEVVTIEELTRLYMDYNMINREMLIARLPNTVEEANNTNNLNQFMIVHFFPDLTEKKDIINTDGINLEKRIRRALKKQIEDDTGKRYTDQDFGKKLEEHYIQARNPLNFKQRVPTKIQYMTINRDYLLVKPNTLISMTIARNGKLKTHIDRKIGFGCFKSSITPEAIYTINSGYNLLNDKNFFGKNQIPISMLSGIQETMADWTKIKPDYIIFIKTQEDYEETEEYKKACKISKESKLPIVIYDINMIIESKKEDKTKETAHDNRF